jgi:hypothetical protein
MLLTLEAVGEEMPNRASTLSNWVASALNWTISDAGAFLQGAHHGWRIGDGRIDVGEGLEQIGDAGIERRRNRAHSSDILP